MFLPAGLIVTHSPTKINMQIYQNFLQLSVESSVIHHVGMTTKVLATVHEDKPDNHFNDGKCDSQSWLWCGTMERMLRWEGSRP